MDERQPIFHSDLSLDEVMNLIKLSEGNSEVNNFCKDASSQGHEFLEGEGFESMHEGIENLLLWNIAMSGIDINDLETQKKARQSTHVMLCLIFGTLRKEGYNISK